MAMSEGSYTQKLSQTISRLRKGETSAGVELKGLVSIIMKNGSEQDIAAMRAVLGQNGLTIYNGQLAIADAASGGVPRPFDAESYARIAPLATPQTQPVAGTRRWGDPVHINLPPIPGGKTPSLGNIGPMLRPGASQGVPGAASPSGADWVSAAQRMATPGAAPAATGNVRQPGDGPGLSGGGVTGLPAVGPGQVNDQFAGMPTDRYFSGVDFKNLAAVTPDYDPATGSSEAWNYYMMNAKNAAGTPLRDTFMADHQAAFESAPMLNFLQSGGGSNDPTKTLAGVDDFMGASSGGGQYLNPEAVLENMFSVLPSIPDPMKRDEYIKYTINALRPFMQKDQWEMLQSQVARQGQQYFSDSMNDPSMDRDFLKYLGSIR